MNDKPELETQGSTLDITESIVAVLKPMFVGKANQLDKVTTLERHKKRFDKVDDIKREVTGTGCIRIVAASVSNVERYAGSTIGIIKFVAFVMTNDQYGKNRSQRAELIANQLGLAVTQPSFSQKLGKMAFDEVKGSSWQNVSTVDFDKIGVAMWAVEWQQKCRFGVPTDINLLDDFVTLGLTVNIPDATIDDEGHSDTPQMQALIKLEQPDNKE